MANPFDQFDDPPVDPKSGGNPFDRFDTPPAAGKKAANPFDQFDPPPPPRDMKSIALDVAKQFVGNIPRGVASTADLAEIINPMTAVPRLVRQKVSDPRSNAQRWEDTGLVPDAPVTREGEYAATAGEVVGSSIAPGAGMIGVGKTTLRAVAPQATNFLSRAMQSGVQYAGTNPGKFAATELASALTGATASEYAKGEGAGKVGQTVAGVVGSILPGTAISYLSRSAAPIGTETGRTLSRQRHEQAIRDAASFDALDIRSFGPAFNQGPVASVGKQLTETPFIGAPLRNNLDETFMDMAAARDRIANAISPNATHETAGQTVQRGLDRFRDRRFHELEPSAVRELGIEPMSPVQRPNTGGQQQLARIEEGMPLVNQITDGYVFNSRGNPVALPMTRAQRLNARTRIEDLDDTELQTIIRTPADRTSFSTRLEALYERANRNLPPLMRENGTRDPLMLPTANAGQVVRGLVQDEARTGVRAGLQGRYGDMFERLANPRASVTLPDLRAMRTAIGRDLANFGTYDASLDRTQLRQLYAALSNDIEIGMQDIAVRAANATRMDGPRQLSIEQAQSAAQALRDNQVADRYARAGFERMDRFLQIVQAPNPQQAAQNLIRMANEGGQGNMRLVRSAMTPLRPEERAEFGSLVVRQMGTPVPSARGVVQESGFSPATFVTNYQKMSPEARALFFTPNHQRELDHLFNVANRIANVEALANTSRSATNAINVTAVTGAVGRAAVGDFVTPLAIGGSGFGISLLMSRPAYTKWMTGYMRLRAAVRDGTDGSIAPLIRHLRGLEGHARLNPELWPVYYQVADEIESLQQAPAEAPKAQ